MVIQRLASFDPGWPHCGTAIWEYRGGRWVCTAAREVDPERFADSLHALLIAGKLTRVAYEVFRLGGGQEAMQQLGSTFGTVEVIGQARLLCRWHGIEMEPIERGVRRATLTRMKAVKWGFPRGSPTHVKDAIAVGASALDWRAANHEPGDGVRTSS